MSKVKYYTAVIWLWLLACLGILGIVVMSFVISPTHLFVGLAIVIALVGGTMLTIWAVNTLMMGR